MIELRGVSKVWTSPVLENVSLKIPKGDFLYVVGDSGAGKSTLLKMLYGEESPTRGLVEVLGMNPAKADTSKLQALRRRLGIIFQDLRLIEELSAFDNVALALETARIDGAHRPFAAAGRAGWRRAIDDALALVGLSRLAKKKVRQLSGGERQRVAAARAIVRQPEILIADEPTGSLDRDQTWSLMDLFQKMHLRGTTVIVATHDREIVRRARRRSCVLKGGKLSLEEGVSLY